MELSTEDQRGFATNICIQKAEKTEKTKTVGRVERKTLEKKSKKEK
jgi:hypothetical protein